MDSFLTLRILLQQVMKFDTSGTFRNSLSIKMKRTGGGGGGGTGCVKDKLN